MSALGQQRTHAPQQTVSLFDYIVGELSELHRHIQAERLGGLEVDHQYVLGWCLHRKVGRLLAFENPAGVNARLSIIRPPASANSRQL
jgi:hypothetical protein